MSTPAEKPKVNFASFNTHIAGQITLASDDEPELVKRTLSCDVKGMRKLLEAGENPNVRGRQNRPSIYWASTLFKNEPLKLLLEFGAEVDMPPGDDRDSPLLHAARSGDTPKMRLLLDAGADPNAVSAGDPLLCRIAESSYPESAALLILRGADVHARSLVGHQPIHLAARNQESRMLAVILQAEGDITSLDGDGKTALQVAVESLRPDSVRLLLQAGAVAPDVMREVSYWHSLLDVALNDPEKRRWNAVQRLVRATLISQRLGTAMATEEEVAMPTQSGGPQPL